MSRLKIIWRNPKTARRERRSHELACDVGRKLYVVEERVPQGDQKRWAQAAALEVVYGGRAIAYANFPRWTDLNQCLRHAYELLHKPIVSFQYFPQSVVR